MDPNTAPYHPTLPSYSQLYPSLSTTTPFPESPQGPSFPFHHVTNIGQTSYASQTSYTTHPSIPQDIARQYGPPYTSHLSGPPQNPWSGSLSSTPPFPPPQYDLSLNEPLSAPPEIGSGFFADQQQQLLSSSSGNLPSRTATPIPPPPPPRPLSRWTTAPSSLSHPISTPHSIVSALPSPSLGHIPIDPHLLLCNGTAAPPALWRKDHHHHHHQHRQHQLSEDSTFATAPADANGQPAENSYGSIRSHVPLPPPSWEASALTSTATPTAGTTAASSYIVSPHLDHHHAHPHLLATSSSSSEAHFHRPSPRGALGALSALASWSSSTSMSTSLSSPPTLFPTDTTSDASASIHTHIATPLLEWSVTGSHESQVPRVSLNNNDSPYLAADPLVTRSCLPSNYANSNAFVSPQTPRPPGAVSGSEFPFAFYPFHPLLPPAPQMHPNHSQSLSPQIVSSQSDPSWNRLVAPDQAPSPLSRRLSTPSSSALDPKAPTARARRPSNLSSVSTTVADVVDSSRSKDQRPKSRRARPKAIKLRRQRPDPLSLPPPIPAHSRISPASRLSLGEQLARIPNQPSGQPALLRRRLTPPVVEGYIPAEQRPLPPKVTDMPLEVLLAMQARASASVGASGSSCPWERPWEGVGTECSWPTYKNGYSYEPSVPPPPPPPQPQPQWPITPGQVMGWWNGQAWTEAGPQMCGAGEMSPRTVEGQRVQHIEHRPATAPVASPHHATRMRRLGSFLRADIRHRKRKSPEGDGEGPGPNKKFKCPDCKEWFTRQNDLKRHARGKHTNEYPYPCPVCFAPFSRSDKLNNHLAKSLYCKELAPSRSEMRKRRRSSGQQSSKSSQSTLNPSLPTII